jgi:hypothetical protein
MKILQKSECERERDLGREEFRLRVWKSSKAPENIE